MDILKPQILTIDGRRYRKMPYTSSEGNSSEIEAQKIESEETCWEEERCDDQEEDAVVEQTNKGYTAYCAGVPSFYYKFVCGKRNETKNRIERETKTQIAIPRPGIEGDIVITGKERSAVLSAKSRIELIVESARGRQVPTHFISIPLACQSTKERFGEFRKLVLEQCAECKGFDETILQTHEKLHLTIGMMALMSDKEIATAAGLLQELKDQIKNLTKNPMRILLEGLDCMNDDPTEVSVLYAKVKLADGSHRLQELVEKIVGVFVSKGVMRREYDRVKLHATVMNTSFRDRLEQARAENEVPMAFRNEAHKKWKKTFFDARTILEVFDDFKFGEKDLDCIHLSKRGSFGADGFYHCESAIDL